MKIALPSENIICYADLLSVEVVGVAELANTNAPAIFTINVPIERLEQNKYAEIDDKLIEGVESITFRYIHKNCVKTDKWIKPKNVELFKQKIVHGCLNAATSSSKIEEPTIENNGFIEINPQNKINWLQANSVQNYKNGACILNENLLSSQDLEHLQRSVDVQATGVITIPEGIVSTRGICYSSDMQERYMSLTRFNSLDAINKCETERRMYKASMYENVCNTSVAYKKGRGINLFAIFSNTNVCHSLLDVGTMLNVSKEAGVDFQDFDWYVVPENKFNIIKELFKRLNIDERKMLYTDRHLKNNEFAERPNGYFFDELVAPSYDGCGDFYRPGSFNYLRSLFYSDFDGALPKRKIYISRENTGRDSVNEGLLLELLTHYGFEIMYPSKALDIPRIMSQASVVVGAHGAGLANCVFCQPGTKVIEFMPEFYVRSYFISLSNAIGLNHYSIMCKEAEMTGIKIDNKTTQSPNRFFIISIPQVKKLLDSIV